MKGVQGVVQGVLTAKSVLEGQSIVLVGLLSGPWQVTEVILMGIAIGWWLDRKDGFSEEECERRGRKYREHQKNECDAFFALSIEQRDEIAAWSKKHL